MRVGHVDLWWIKSTRLTLMAHKAHRAHQRAICIASLLTPRCSFTRVERTLQPYCPKWGALE